MLLAVVVLKEAVWRCGDAAGEHAAHSQAAVSLVSISVPAVQTALPGGALCRTTLAAVVTHDPVRL